jgi:MFS family permease
MIGMVELGALLRRNADFRRLFLATVISLLGDWFTFVAVSGFVAERTGRPGLAAIVYAASVLPIFFLSPIAGVFADRWDRRRLMVAADLLRVIPALGLLLALHLGSAALAIACVLLLSGISAFFEPAAGAATPNLVEPGELSLAQAAMGSVWGSMLFVGAALGGLITAWLGRQAAVILDAATFVVSAALIAGIRRPLRVGQAAGATLLGHLGEVWRFIRADRVVQALLTVKTGVGVANGIVGLLPAYALARLGAGDAGVGALLAARGLGALLGPFVARPFASGGRRLILVCGGSILTYAIAYVVFPFTSSVALALLCVMLAHAGGGAQWALSTYGLQLATPDEVRGRVLSLDYGVATLTIGVSALAAGGAAQLFGLDAASWGLAGVGLVYGVAWLLWTRPLWRGPADPLAGRPRAQV